jgi:flagellar biosynthesis component FlhA
LKGTSSIFSLAGKVAMLAAGIFLILEVFFAVSVPGALPILSLIGLSLLVGSYVVKGIKEYRQKQKESTIEIIYNKKIEEEEEEKEKDETENTKVIIPKNSNENFTEINQL